ASHGARSRTPEERRKRRVARISRRDLTSCWFDQHQGDAARQFSARSDSPRQHASLAVRASSGCKPSMEIATWRTHRGSAEAERGRYASCLRDQSTETTRTITMDKPRERLARWMKDGSALLTQLLDDLNRTKTSLTERERECATLREENTRFRKERREVVEK